MNILDDNEPEYTQEDLLAIQEEVIRRMLTRPDGRPEAYAVPDVGTERGYRCTSCVSKGHTGLHPANRIAMMSPMNMESGESEFLCMDCIPENTVIYDPNTNKCRDVKGENVWEEK